MQIEYGKQRRLALVVGISAQAICQYLGGSRNAPPPVAQRLGAVTGSDPFIWMLSDDEATHAANVAQRQAAAAAWEPPESMAGEPAGAPVESTKADESPGQSPANVCRASDSPAAA
jgi:plasmid maintenance system antidote protein VapI